MHTLKSFASIFLIIFTVTACSQSSNHDNKTADGTGDSGGGNTYQGKPLESYIKKPAELEAFKKFVKSMMDTVDQNEVGYVFRGLFLSKAWYFVPGPLKGLPNSKIGSTVPTDQVALQDFDSIWVDSNIFDSMAVEDQAKLLIHELLMGAKLLRFDSYKHACLITNTRYPEKETCSEASNIPLGSPSDLTPNDYTIIRQTVAQIFSNYQNMKAGDWEQLLGENEFDSPPAIVFETQYNVKTMSLSEIANSFSTSLQNGYKPKYGFDYKHLLEQNPNLGKISPTTDVYWNSHESCSIDFSVKDREYTFKLQMGDQSIVSTQLLMGDEIKLHKRSEFADAPVWNASLWMFDPSIFSGEQPYYVELNFEDSGRLKYVSVRGTKCFNNDCASAPTPLPINRLEYKCSISSQIKFN